MAALTLRRAKRWLFSLIIVLVGCAPLQPGNSAPPAATSATSPAAEVDLVGSHWQLVSYGAPGAETTVVGAIPVTLNFDTGGMAVGSSGCNNYGGQFQVQGNSLTFSEMVSTQIACMEGGVMEQEQAFLTALATVSEFSLSGEQLLLTYDNGQGVLTFGRAGPPIPVPGGEITPTMPITVALLLTPSALRRGA